LFQNRKELINNFINSLLPILFVLFALFLHLYRLGEVPRGMYVDEMGMAYDAWSLGKFGVDRYSKSFPLYLINFGGGQSALYCYLDILFIKFGGITALMARIPAVIFSMITCIFGYRLTKRHISNQAGLIALFLFCILPYFTISGRIALDCNLMLGMCTVMLYQIGEILEGRSSKYRLILLGITIGITFYTYALSYIIIPIFLIVLVIYLFWCGKNDLKQYILASIPMIILAIPLVIIQIINIFDLPEVQLGPFTLTKMLSYRGGELTLSIIKDNLRWLYVSLFKVDITEFDNFAPYSNMYIISIPILVLGIGIMIYRLYVSLRNRVVRFDTLILLWIGVICCVSLIITGVTTYRINAIFIGLLYALSLGIDYIFTKCRYIAWPIICIYIAFFISFYHFYFYEYENTDFPHRLFAESMDAPVEVLGSQSEEIQARPTCVLRVDESYVYYFSALLSAPSDYDIATYGNNGDGLPDENGNIKEHGVAFWTTEPYDARYNYIIYCPGNEQIDELKSMNFNIIEADNYIVAVPSWLQ